MRANMRRRTLGDAFQAGVGPDLGADLRARLPIDLDDVGGEVVLAAQQRRAHAVRVDRHALGLEAPDLVSREAAGDDDVDVAVAGVVERGADLLDERRLHAAQVAALQRLVDQPPAGVEGPGPPRGSPPPRALPPSASLVWRRAPHSRSPSASAPSSAVPPESLVKSTRTVTFISSP